MNKLMVYLQIFTVALVFFMGYLAIRDSTPHQPLAGDFNYEACWKSLPADSQQSERMEIRFKGGSDIHTELIARDNWVRQQQPDHFCGHIHVPKDYVLDGARSCWRDGECSEWGSGL